MKIHKEKAEFKRNEDTILKLIVLISIKTSLKKMLILWVKSWIN